MAQAERGGAVGQRDLLADRLSQLGGRADVRGAQAGKLRDVLRRIRRLLLRAQGSDGALDALGLLIIQRRRARGETTGERPLLAAFGRPDLDLGEVIVVEEHLRDQLLEVALVKGDAQAGERVFVAQVGNGRVLIVEPARKARHRHDHAVSGPRVALAHDELRMRERRVDKRPIEPSVGQTPRLARTISSRRGAQPGFTPFNPMSANGWATASAK